MINTTIVSLDKVPRFPSKFIRLKPNLQRFLGYLPTDEQWSLSLYGEAGSGKSTFALIVADQLAHNGKVLYVTNEENPKSGSIGARSDRAKMTRKNNVDLLETKSPQAMWDALANTQYKFCIIDSINEFFDQDENQVPAKKITKQRERFPNVSFVLISQTNTKGKAAGGKSAAFRADVIVYCYQINKKKPMDGCLAVLEKYRYGSTTQSYSIFGNK